MSSKSAAEIEFEAQVARNVEGLGNDTQMHALTRDWFTRSTRHSYSYNFRWMGRPVIQYPQDMMALQEIIWETRPDVIVETGIAHGGSLVFSAAMLTLLGGERRVIGIDIDIRPHNRAAIEAHPMAPLITMVQGSSIDDGVVERVKALIGTGKRVMVQLDSNHTHDHVLAELRHYAPLVTPGCYLVVFDGVIEDLPPEFSKDRPWGVGDNPKTATHAFLAEDDRFEIDRRIQDKLQITVAPDGYLRRLR